MKKIMIFTNPMRSKNKMQSLKKVGIGATVTAFSAAAVYLTVKLAGRHRKKVYTEGFKAGHFAGMVGGSRMMLGIAQDAVQSARESDDSNTSLMDRYNKLREEYDALQSEYNELLEYYSDDE